MAIIRAYVAEHEPAVAEFNDRLQAGGSAFSFRTSAPAAGEQWSAFVAVDHDKDSGRPAVRGGYIGVRHRFSVCGEDVDVHHLKLPLSESTVDPQYNAVGVQLLVDAQRRYPLSFVLGMGGRHGVLPRMLESLGWTLADVPFFFRVTRPSRFLRQVSWLRTTPTRALTLDLLAASGLGLGILPVHAWLGRRTSRRRGVIAAEVADWGDGDFVESNLGGGPIEGDVRRTPRRRPAPRALPADGSALSATSSRAGRQSDRLGAPPRHAACRPQAVRRHAPRIARGRFHPSR